MSTQGTKRPHPEPDAHERRDRPRDWRDAYLDEERTRSRSRDYRDDRDRGYGRERSRDYRDRDRERHGRSYHRARDDRRDRDRPRDRADSREEGEIESPPRTTERLPERSERDRSRAREREREHDRERYDHERDRNRERDSRVHRDRGEREREHRDRDRLNASPRKFQSVTLPRSEKPPSPAKNDRRATVKESTPEPEPEPEEEDEEKRIEERRRKREALLAKFRDKPASSVSPASPAAALPGSGVDSVVSNGVRTGINTESGATPLLKMLGARSVTGGVSVAPSTGVATPAQEPSLAHTPLGNDFDLEKKEGAQKEAIPAGVSAAEYDDVADEAQRAKEHEAAHDAAHAADPPKATNADDEWEEVEIEVEEEEEEEDMFAAFGEATPVKKMRKVKVRRRKGGGGEVQILEKPMVAAALEVVDNVDDTEGYYRITPGEILDDGRYQVTVTLGKGMFSAVVKAKVLKAVGQERHADVVGREVAIKLMRSQESMYVAGRKEAQILKLLNDADPEDKKHIVRMERTFEHKGHLAIVTESLSMNLRDVIKRFGKDVGLNMRAVRAYAHQMLLSLSLMRKCNIVHADIKPDNVLVSENKAVLKMCDLGTAAEVGEGDITPYLVSRFYRAPEIILGLPYDTAIDMWSIGCTLFELYTGKILFPGRSNNHMLFLMMETRGKLPHRMIKKAQLGSMHFDENNNFLSAETDRITGADIIKTVVITRATRDLRSRLMPSSSVQARMGIDELKQLQAFVDLLEKCLMLDPVRRISPREALLHPFVAG